MKSALHVAAWISAAAISGHVVDGCLDFTPINRLPADDAGGQVESGADGSAAESPCLSCANKGADAGGCASEFAQCDAFPECKATVQCVVSQCFAPNVDIVQCLGACEQDGGISASQGAPNDAFAAFLQCMMAHCVSVCLH